MIPGTFLSPRDVDIGDLVQAKDPGDIWYDAKIMRIDRDNGPLRIVARYTGKYRGWKAKDMVVDDRLSSKRFRWRKSKSELALERDVQQTGGVLTGRNDDGTWTLEKLIKKRDDFCVH